MNALRKIPFINFLVIIALFEFSLNARSPRSLASVELKVTKMRIQMALEDFKSELGRYPSATEGLAILIDCRKIARCPKDGTAYLDKRYTFDPWKRPFQYKVSLIGKPMVTSLGEDGMVGGSGPNRDFDLLLDDLEGLDPIDYRRLIEKACMYILIVTVFLIPIALIGGLIALKNLYWRIFFGITLVFYVISVFFGLGSLAS
ncbi:MAG: type II secretion system protein GspG [Turneriella sp.]